MSGVRRRTTLFIARRFQIRFISLILLMMFVIVGITGYTVYVTTWIMFGEKLAAVYPQGLLLDIVKQVNAVLLMRLLFLLPLILLVGLVLSNRIAGPIYRIKRYLNKVSGGSYAGSLMLRKKDELQDLAEIVNKLVVKLRSDRDRRVKKVEEVKLALEEVSSGKADLTKTIEEVRRDLDLLKRG